MSNQSQTNDPSLTLTLTPIGQIRSPFQHIQGMPIQPSGAKGVPGRVVLAAEYTQGLADLDGFSHIILIYFFHRSHGYDLMVKPFLDDRKRGVFATRAPRRPNPIGLSVVRLLSVEDHTLHVEGVDVVDGTPLLDIKPFVPNFDAPPQAAIGWLEGQADKSETFTSDQRFK